MDTVRFWNWITSYHTSHWHLIAGPNMDAWKLTTVVPWLTLVAIGIFAYNQAKRSFAQVKLTKLVDQQSPSGINSPNSISVYHMTWQVIGSDDNQLWLWPTEHTVQDQEPHKSTFNRMLVSLACVTLTVIFIAWSCAMMIDSLGGLHQWIQAQFAPLLIVIGMGIVLVIFGWQLKNRLDHPIMEPEPDNTHTFNSHAILIRRDGQ